MSGDLKNVKSSDVKGQKIVGKGVSKKLSFLDLKRKHEEGGLTSSKKVDGQPCRISTLHAGSGWSDHQKLDLKLRVTFKRVWSFKKCEGLVVDFVDEFGDEIRGTAWDPSILYFDEKLEVGVSYIFSSLIVIEKKYELSRIPYHLELFLTVEGCEFTAFDASMISIPPVLYNTVRGSDISVLPRCAVIDFVGLVADKLTVGDEDTKCFLRKMVLIDDSGQEVCIRTDKIEKWLDVSSISTFETVLLLKGLQVVGVTPFVDCVPFIDTIVQVNPDSSTYGCVARLRDWMLEADTGV